MTTAVAGNRRDRLGIARRFRPALDRRVLLPALACVLLGAPFLDYHLGFLAGVGLVPLLVFAGGEPSARRVGITTWLVGIAFSLLTMVWLLQARLTDVVAVTGTQSAFVHVFAWLLVAGVWSLQFLGFGLALAGVRRGLSSASACLVLATAWGAGEAGRALLASLISWGPGASIGTLWNFDSLGFAVAGTPLVFIARLVGLYGTAMVVVLVNVAIFWLVSRRNRRLAACALALVAVLAGIGYAAYPTGDGKQLAVSTVRLGQDTARYAGQLTRDLTAGRPPRANLLVLPEGSDFFRHGLSPDKRQLLERALRPDGVVVSSGPELRSAGRRTGQIVYRDRNGKVLELQEKNFLIPAGEFMPVVAKFMLEAIGRGDTVATHARRRLLERGRVPEHPFEHAGTVYGALECSGILAPRLYSRMARSGAQVLINSASLALLSGSRVFLEQDRQMGRFAAVATGKPLVQGVRGGRAFVIDGNGGFRYESRSQGASIGWAKVRASTAETLYDRLGEWLLAACLLVVAGLAVWRVVVIRRARET